MKVFLIAFFGLCLKNSHDIITIMSNCILLEMEEILYLYLYLYLYFYFELRGTFFFSYEPNFQPTGDPLEGTPPDCQVPKADNHLSLFPNLPNIHLCPSTTLYPQHNSTKYIELSLSGSVPPQRP